LRARALGETVLGPIAHGWAVLVRSGLPAWLAQVRQAIPGASEASASFYAPAPIAAAASTDETAALIVILASMLLSITDGGQR